MKLTYALVTLIGCTCATFLNAELVQNTSSFPPFHKAIPFEPWADTYNQAQETQIGTYSNENIMWWSDGSYLGPTDYAFGGRGAGWRSVDHGKGIATSVQDQVVVLFRFDRPVSSAGCFLQYTIGWPKMADGVWIEALDKFNRPLESHNLWTEAPVPAEQDGAFRGIVRKQNDIYGLQIRSNGSFIGMDDLTIGRIGGTLVNISTRSMIGKDGVLIAGFVVEGDTADVLVRAIGPGLAPFGVSGHIKDPVLRIHRGDEVLKENDDWASDSINGTVIADISAKAGAFPLDAASKDAAVLITLPPGPYTAVARSKDGTAGEILIEVYRTQ